MVRILSILILLFFLFGCNQITPSGNFWKSFNESEINQEEFDHGTWGGTTVISWGKKDDSKFSQKQIIEFAEENGWLFVDEADVEEVISSDEFSYSIINNGLDLTKFKKSTILRFYTNTLTINEDTQMDTQNNCFAILSENRDSLTVYYQWGDFLY